MCHLWCFGCSCLRSSIVPDADSFSPIITESTGASTFPWRPYVALTTILWLESFFFCLNIFFHLFILITSILSFCCWVQPLSSSHQLLCFQCWNCWVHLFSGAQFSTFALQFLQHINWFFFFSFPFLSFSFFNTMSVSCFLILSFLLYDRHFPHSSMHWYTI